MRKGWFKLPGEQDGDRTLEEQILAVRPALAEARGKVVLDLGSAEGLIAREFALAGAARVRCMEAVADHIVAGRKVCAGLPVEFTRIDLNTADESCTLIGPGHRYDIVLALGVIHKLHSPEAGLRFAAAACAGLLLLRSGRGAVDGVIRSKHRKNATCDAPAMLGQLGFRLEKEVAGPPERLEDVQYWRRG